MFIFLVRGTSLCVDGKLARVWELTMTSTLSDFLDKHSCCHFRFARRSVSVHHSFLAHFSNKGYATVWLKIQLKQFWVLILLLPRTSAFEENIWLCLWKKNENMTQIVTVWRISYKIDSKFPYWKLKFWTANFTNLNLPKVSDRFGSYNYWI